MKIMKKKTHKKKHNTLLQMKEESTQAYLKLIE